MEIKTERLLLRSPRPEDAGRMLEIRNSAYVMKYNVMKPADRERMLREIREDRESGRAMYLELASTGELIGGLWMEEDSLRYGVNAVMMEYYLDETRAGRGYMTEALKAALDYAFDTLGADLVSARAFSENKSSVKVLEKLGFRLEGTLRCAIRAYSGVVYDDMLFSLLKEEYRPR